ncbi:MAG: hypothetical protein ACTH2Q_03865 [Propionibacteriaceae bacterium]
MAQIVDWLSVVRSNVLVVLIVGASSYITIRLRGAELRHVGTAN